MDSIWMIDEPRYTGEDSYGYDYYEDFVAHEYGFFLSEEDAQAWIDKQHEKERAQFAKKETDWETKLALWKDECANIDSEFAKLQKVVKESGIRTELRTPHKPYAPMRPTLELTKYGIVEVERGS